LGGCVKLVEESLQAIFEAEQKARGQIEAAKREASLILENAHKEAEKIKEESRATTKSKIQKIIDESRERAEAEVQALLKDAQRKALAMEKKANERREEAIKLILETILR